MRLRLRRRAWLGGGLVVVAVAAAAAHLVLSPGTSRHVPLPADDATPERVVGTYLESLAAHDCATAEQLTTRNGRHDVTRWCADVGSLRDVHVGRQFVDPDQGSRGSAAGPVVVVPVSFDLDWRPFHDDGTVPEGTTTWSYRLVRSTAGGPWRIVDQGDG